MALTLFARHDRNRYPRAYGVLRSDVSSAAFTRVSEHCLMVLALLLIVTLTIFHASMVLLVNMPSNPIKHALSPVLHRYGGPHLWQGWSLFAPDVANANLHVLVRGRTVDNKTTPWYDASLYFIDESAKAGLGVDRISEGLFHAAQTIVARHDAISNSEQRVVLERTSAMILLAYAGSRHLTAMEIEVDSRDIPSAGEKPKAMDSAMEVQLGWRPIPHVTSL
jgi:hypothetical protein